MEKMIKKNDVLLFVIILAVAALLFVLSAALQKPGSEVRVVSGRELFGAYALEEDLILEIQEAGSLNVIAIAGGKVEMKEANCPKGDCLWQQPISRVGQTIVCLPNKILVTIDGEAGGKGEGPDSIVY